VLAELHSERFVDSRAARCGHVADEGRICSQRHDGTAAGPNGEAPRGARPARPPAYAAPDLLAERVNEVWSWDISSSRAREVDLLLPLRDPHVFSRYAVGMAVQHRESADLATALIAQATEQQRIAPER